MESQNSYTYGGFAVDDGEEKGDKKKRCEGKGTGDKDTDKDQEKKGENDNDDPATKGEKEIVVSGSHLFVRTPQGAMLPGSPFLRKNRFAGGIKG